MILIDSMKIDLRMIFIIIIKKSKNQDNNNIYLYTVKPVHNGQLRSQGKSTARSR